MGIFNFVKPDKIVLQKATDFEAQFEFRPLEPGYGVTIGNALRRVLLNSLEGYAIVGINISGADHEFATIKGVTGENLIKLLEARLDNTVDRMGISISRQGARQLVSHKHITVNGDVLNIPSYSCKPGDVIGLKNKSAANTAITGNLRGKNPKFNWVEWSEGEMKGTFITYPERESVPENIKEQLIVELYSK